MEFLNWCLSFLRRNWKWFLPLCVDLVVFLVLLLKKKVKVVDVFSMVLTKLPVFINRAEELYSNGDDKLKYVLSCAVSLLAAENGSNVTDILEKYGDLLINAIEEILSTPHKKGD